MEDTTSKHKFRSYTLIEAVLLVMHTETTENPRRYDNMTSCTSTTTTTTTTSLTTTEVAEGTPENMKLLSLQQNRHRHRHDDSSKSKLKKAIMMRERRKLRNIVLPPTFQVIISTLLVVNILLSVPFPKTMVITTAYAYIPMNTCTRIRAIRSSKRRRNSYYDKNTGTSTTASIVSSSSSSSRRSNTQEEIDSLASERKDDNLNVSSSYYYDEAEKFFHTNNNNINGGGGDATAETDIKNSVDGILLSVKTNGEGEKKNFDSTVLPTTTTNNSIRNGYSKKESSSSSDNGDDMHNLAKVLTDDNDILSNENDSIFQQQNDDEIANKANQNEDGTSGRKNENLSGQEAEEEEEGSSESVDSSSIEERKQIQIRENEEYLNTLYKLSITRRRRAFNRIKRIFGISSRRPNITSTSISNTTELMPNDGTSITSSSNTTNISYDDDDNNNNNNDNSNNKEPYSLRRLWRKRNARTLEEGIRREQTRTNKLSSLMNRALIERNKKHDKSYVERSLMGLLNGLAIEVEDLDIELTTTTRTPIWRKEVDEIRINFSRLGFGPIRFGGSTTPPATTTVTNSIDDKIVDNNSKNKNDQNNNSTVSMTTESSSKEQKEDESLSELNFVECADEGFDRIDEDNSGTLDSVEIAQALNSISGLKPTDQDSIEELALDLVRLYDYNGDGEVDREEYKQMVADMAKLRAAEKEDNDDGKGSEKNPFNAVKDSIQSVSQGISKKAAEASQGISRKAVAVASAARDSLKGNTLGEDVLETEMGSIVLSKVNLDLRRLLFGGLPFVKKVAPGGPLILEPFTATVTASFTREDVMGSFLVDAALKRLVARALRVRLRSLRDIGDGAWIFGRQWKMTCETAPVVEVLGFSNVEFDNRDKLIITGRARIRASPDALLVEQTFKLRTKIGTRKNGQVIKLVEPELALVFECPPVVEKGVNAVCGAMGFIPPERPDPYYSFFPIYSPFQVDDDTGGFDMGEDNCIRSIYVRNGKLRFEISVVLRPGRFLGNYYLAFTVPQRTFIITMDRVWNGVRAARENKKVTARAKQLAETEEIAAAAAAAFTVEDSSESASVSSSSTDNEASSKSFESLSSTTEVTPHSSETQNGASTPKPKSFYDRFVEGYTMAEREGEANNERLTDTISDWFGRQGRGNVTSSTTTNDQPE